MRKFENFRGLLPAQAEQGVLVLRPGRDHDGHVVFLHDRGVLLRPERLSSLQPPPQDGGLRRLGAEPLGFIQHLTFMEMLKYIFSTFMPKSIVSLKILLFLLK